MFDKNFLIYDAKVINSADKSKNFQNKNKLGKPGRVLYGAFQVWCPADNAPNSFGTARIQNVNEDPYFRYIEKIYITSQQRRPDEDKYVNSHTRDLAVDFYIFPVWLMPYYSGKLFKAFKNNIYISVDNKHIHFDIDPDKGNGLKYQKSVMVETAETKVTGKIFPVAQLIDKVISFYGVDTILAFDHAPFGMVDDTKKQLLDTSDWKPYVGSAESKLDVKIEKAVNESPFLKNVGNAIDFGKDNKYFLIFIAVLLVLLILAVNFLPERIQQQAIEKLKQTAATQGN